MICNDDILTKLQDFIREESNKQTEALKKEFLEVKEVIAAEQEKVSLLVKQVEELKIKNNILEKQLRKNNIIIFNLDYKNGDLLQYTLSQLNHHLKINLFGNDINNIYTIRNQPSNRPIIVQFVSYLKKKAVLSNCFNLKNTPIRISDELSKEDRQERKILVDHLKLVRTQNKKAHISGNKLYVEGELITVKDLKNEEDENYVGNTEKSKNENEKSKVQNQNRLG